MYRYYNPNPVGRTTVDDCTVRALAAALDVSWEDAFAMTAMNGYQMGDMQNANSVWGAVLRQNGFYRQNIPNTCPDCYTVEKFARDNPQGTYVIGTGSHVVTIIDGDWFDTYNSKDEVPAYFWAR